MTEQPKLPVGITFHNGRVVHASDGDGNTAYQDPDWDPSDYPAPTTDTEMLRRVVPDLKRVVLKFPVFHAGWELDNDGWLVERSGGERVIVLTNHNSPYVAKAEELQELALSYEAALDPIRAFLGAAQSPGEAK